MTLMPPLYSAYSAQPLPQRPNPRFGVLVSVDEELLEGQRAVGKENRFKLQNLAIRLQNRTGGEGEFLEVGNSDREGGEAFIEKNSDGWWGLTYFPSGPHRNSEDYYDWFHATTMDHLIKEENNLVAWIKNRAPENYQEKNDWTA